jgi:hypothetical protein
MLVGDCAPSAIASIDDRLRSRFEGGLALELSSGSPGEIHLVHPEEAKDEDKRFVPSLEQATGSSGEARKPGPSLAPVAVTEPPKKGGAWFPSPENVVLHWPKLADLMIEELE